MGGTHDRLNKDIVLCPLYHKLTPRKALPRCYSAVDCNSGCFDTIAFQRWEQVTEELVSEVLHSIGEGNE